MNKVRLEKQSKVGKSTEKVRFWEIETDEAEVFSAYGFTDSDESKIKHNSYSTVGKNIGHINETDSTEQAQKEAMSLINKKVKDGYKVVEGQDELDAYQDLVAERKVLIEQAKADKKVKAEAKESDESQTA